MFSYFKNRKTTYIDVLSKLQYRNENQKCISNFKKPKWHFGYTDFPVKIETCLINLKNK